MSVTSYVRGCAQKYKLKMYQNLERKVFGKEERSGGMKLNLQKEMEASRDFNTWRLY